VKLVAFRVPSRSCCAVVFAFWPPERPFTPGMLCPLDDTDQSHLLQSCEKASPPVSEPSASRDLTPPGRWLVPNTARRLHGRRRSAQASERGDGCTLHRAPADYARLGPERTRK